MLNKITTLKANTSNEEVKVLCENAMSLLNSAIYNNVTRDAKQEIEEIAINNLFEGISNLSDKDVYTSKWLAREQKIYSINNLGIKNVINRLLESEGQTNPTLHTVLKQWKEYSDVNKDLKIYESFINAMGAYSYYPAVDSELQSLKQKVELYKVDINISKILETMKETQSAYLVPIIEHVVNEYINDKTTQTKFAAKAKLEKFAYDAFIRDILNIITADATALQLEYNNPKNDISTIYSPVHYLGENEAIFNSSGDFYIKKGNVLSKLSEKEIISLPSKFINLCNILNDNRIEVSNESVKVYINNDIAEINESFIKINDSKFDGKQLLESATKAALGYNNREIYDISGFIFESFNDIAEIDFGKRIYDKNNVLHYADIFKLRDNIFITTNESVLNKKTFYKCINPIQAKSVIMEHLRHDVTSVFSSIMPKHDKIVKEINETKKQYAAYINKLETNINQFKKYDNTTANLVICELKEELTSVKNEFKEYNIRAEEYLRPVKLEEGLTLTIANDQTGETQTVVLPDTNGTSNQPESDTSNMTGLNNAIPNGVTGVQQPNTESPITFDSNDSEVLGNNPSDEGDKITTNVDSSELEKEAEDIEKEAEQEQDALNQDGAGDMPKTKTGDDNELEQVSDDENEENNKEEKLFLKKENVSESLNEGIQISDSIKYKTMIGKVTGKMHNGDYIVTCNPDGKTYQVKESDITKILSYPTLNLKQFKFDKTTQKVLFEQNVRCGIYMGNIAVKLNECIVNYAEWKNAGEQDKINVIVEGKNTLMDKNNIRILEDVNTFANIDNYIPCKIIKECGVIDALVNMLDINKPGLARTVTMGDDSTPLMDVTPTSIIEIPENTEDETSEMPNEIEFTIKIDDIQSSNPSVSIEKNDINKDEKEDSNDEDEKDETSEK